MKGEITPDRWINCGEGQFPQGGNPWTEIYTDEVVRDIGKIIALEGPLEIEPLRIQLAATAEYLSSVFDFTGGAATAAKKRDWAEEVDTKCLVLMTKLDSYHDNLSSVVIRDDEANRFVPASEMRTRIQSVQNAVFALQELLQAVPEVVKMKGQKTSHSQTLQIVVDGMTEVFIDLVSVDFVKRSSSEGQVDGLFPEFIRKAAHPFLKAYYNKFSKSAQKIENLNRQIQKAVSKYS